jgi:hypothetical protein
MITNKVPFKVGIDRYVDGSGWTHEYGIFNLDPDSTLGDMPESYREDETIMEMVGLRHDQPGYDQVHDYTSLIRLLFEEEDSYESEEYPTLWR